MTLAKLRPAHIANWQQTLEERGGGEGRALSAKTTFHARALLSAALRWGCKMQLLALNPCAVVDAPKVRRSDARALTRDEMARLLIVARGTRWGPFVTLALSLGARRGELLALRWSCVDDERRTVTIANALSQTKEAGITVKGTKTDRTRTLPLSRPALEALARQHVMQAADKLRAGAVYQDSGFVFADKLGRMPSPMAATNAYARLAAKAKLSSTRLHDLRHSAATMLLLSGVDVRTVAGVLGHSVATTTLNTYAHLMAESEREAIDKLGSSLEDISIAEPSKSANG
jgi:integrase